MPSTCCSNARHNYEAVDSNYIVILSIQKSMETRLRFQIPKSINCQCCGFFFQIQVILGNEKICASVSISLLCCSEILLACYMLLQNALAVYVHCSVFCKKYSLSFSFVLNLAILAISLYSPSQKAVNFFSSVIFLHCVFHLITEMEIFYQLNWRKKVCKADVVSSSG